MRAFALTLFLAASALAAPPPIFPLKDVRAGQHGVGRTVFSGSRIEEFQVDILGVLVNYGPRQSIILAKLSGGPLAKTGVLQGMSGSPVYIDGRLLGAVALGFPMSTEAIAGIRPIEEMLQVNPESAVDPPHAGSDGSRQIAAASRPIALSRDARLEEISTPVSFSGFTESTLEHFAPSLRALGLDPRQGVSGGGTPSDRLGDPSQIKPGSMISIQLLSGDWGVGADGTVTMIDGNRVYAFGHRFLAGGSTDLPFARSEVLALLPNLQSSFKISAPREWIGSITQDRSVAVSGLTGRRAEMTPIEIRVGSNAYHMNMIDDRVMSPMLVQMAVFSTIDATERTVGPSTFRVTGTLNFGDSVVKLDSVTSADVNAAAIAALGVSTPISYAMSSGFDSLKLKGVSLNIGVVERSKETEIVGVSVPRQVRPGEPLEIAVTLAAENGVETVKKVHYQVPVGASSGTLYVTAADATTTNQLEFQQAVGAPVRSPADVFALLNGLRANTRAYVRLWRAESAFTIDGHDLPSPPPSLSMILSRGQSGNAQLNWHGAKVAEIEIPVGDTVVTGTKTAQAEVKE